MISNLHIIPYLSIKATRPAEFRSFYRRPKAKGSIKAWRIALPGGKVNGQQLTGVAMLRAMLYFVGKVEQKTFKVWDTYPKKWLIAHRHHHFSGRQVIPNHLQMKQVKLVDQPHGPMSLDVVFFSRPFPMSLYHGAGLYTPTPETNHIYLKKTTLIRDRRFIPTRGWQKKQSSENSPILRYPTDPSENHR